MAESLKGKTLKGTFWSSIERFSAQGVGFLVMVIMARILTPSDYGLVGELTVFIAISQALVDSGFSQALIRKQDRTETDNSTVFYFNIVVGLVLYLILYACAPLIAKFYGEPILTPMTRLISLSILINSLVVVQRAILTINIDFKTQAKASFTASVLAGIGGIWLAYRGSGVWSIVWYQLMNLCFNAVLLWYFSQWRPRLLYSWKSFRELFGFGSKLAAASVLNSVYNNIYLLVIGKVFKTSDLGYYTRAHQFSDFPSSNLTGVLQRVIYPVLCSITDNKERLKQAYLRFLRIAAFVIFPLMMGLAAVAHPLIVLVLEEKWAFSAVLLQILCFSMMWYPIHAINLNLLQAEGRSDLFLKLEVWKKLLGLTILCITLPFGLVAMCWGMVLNSIIALIINTHYTGKLIGLGLFKQLKDVFPALFYSISMGLVVWLFVQILPGNATKLAGGIAIGILYYLFVTKITGSRDLRELISLIKNRN